MKAETIVSRTVPAADAGVCTGAAFGSLGPKTQDLMSGLFERGKANMSDDDLYTLSMQRESAEVVLGGIDHLCETLGCLLNYEASHATKLGEHPSGLLGTPGEVADMLFIVMNMAQHARGLLEVAGAAEEEKLIRGLRHG
ncbi:MAG: hypothetical protein IV093_03570 [Rubrivivax sp.]|nr:hypothetical protein [Rubrivivax sp.]